MPDVGMNINLTEDEPTPAPETEQVEQKEQVEEATEVVEATEETVEGTTEEATEETTKETTETESAQEAVSVVDPAIEAASRQWDETVPEMAGMYTQLPQEARDKVLYSKIEAGKTLVKPEEAENSGPPPIRAIPQLDKTSAQDLLMQQLADGDAGAAKETRAKIDEYDTAITGVLYDQQMQQEWYRKDMEKTLISIQRPEQIRVIGAGIPGFEESDVAKAVAELDKGGITDMTAAVRYVVAIRQNATGKPAPLTAAEKAARQAAATTAASAPGSLATPTPTTIQPSPRFDSPSLKQALMHDLEQSRQRGKA